MKTVAYITFFIILLISCNKQNIDDVSIKPNVEMLKIMDDFVKDNECSDCVFELYIDKVDPHNYTTILYSGKQSLVGEENFDNQQQAINIAKTTNGTEFKIYSGIEYYFRKGLNKENIILKIKQYDNSKNSILIVKDSFGKLTTIKQSYAYPFMSLPKPDMKTSEIIMTKDSVSKN